MQKTAQVTKAHVSKAKGVGKGLLQWVNTKLKVGDKKPTYVDHFAALRQSFEASKRQLNTFMRELEFAGASPEIRSQSVEYAKSKLAVKMQFGMTFAKPGQARGLPLVGVADNQAASHAGLRAGDVLLQVNDTEIVSQEDFATAVRGLGVGDRVSYRVLRIRKDEPEASGEISLQGIVGAQGFTMSQLSHLLQAARGRRLVDPSLFDSKPAFDPTASFVWASKEHKEAFLACSVLMDDLQQRQTGLENMMSQLRKQTASRSKFPSSADPLGYSSTVSSASSFLSSPSSSLSSASSSSSSSSSSITSNIAGPTTGPVTTYTNVPSTTSTTPPSTSTTPTVVALPPATTGTALSTTTAAIPDSAATPATAPTIVTSITPTSGAPITATSTPTVSTSTFPLAPADAPTTSSAVLPSLAFSPPDPIELFRSLSSSHSSLSPVHFDNPTPVIDPTSNSFDLDTFITEARSKARIEALAQKTPRGES